MIRHLLLLCTVLFVGVFVFSSCGDPPDETPLGREIAAIMARPEVKVDKVKLQHVLVAFVGATRGSESGRNYAEARALTEDLLKRARAGEDFPALMDKYSTDEGGGTYTLTQTDRKEYAKNFQSVGFRLAVGEVGVSAYDPSKGPFGWHVIKRIE